MLAVMQMEKEGLSEQEARDHIFMMDSGGLIVDSRSPVGHKAEFSKNTECIKDIEKAVHTIQPNILIGIDHSII